MKNENFKIFINDREVADIYPDLMSLEIETDLHMTHMARIVLPLEQWSDGTWSYLDDIRFTAWKKISVKVGFDRINEMFSGYITHVKPVFEGDVSKNRLEIWAMDKRVRLDREEKLKAWDNKKDSDIVAEILGEHGFKPTVEDTRIVHDQTVSTIIQRETDLNFLKRLASRNGFDFYVEGDDAYFRKPSTSGNPQPVLAAHFGEKSTLARFEIEVNALDASNVFMFAVNRMEKEIEDTEVTKTEDKLLGKSGPETYSAPGLPEPKVFMAMNPVSGKPEMEELCKGMFHRAQWFVTAEGEIAGNLYKHVLKTGETVTVKGVGKTYSGIWYVTHVTHSLTPRGGYVQRFKVKRNSLLPSGMENF